MAKVIGLRDGIMGTLDRLARRWLDYSERRWALSLTREDLERMMAEGTPADVVTRKPTSPWFGDGTSTNDNPTRVMVGRPKWL